MNNNNFVKHLQEVLMLSHNTTFIYNQIDFLWNLINFLGSQYCLLNPEMFTNKSEYTKKSKEETISIVQDFFDKNNMNISIRELINNNTLKFMDEKRLNELEQYHCDGLCYLSKDNAPVIETSIRNSFCDALILIHEIIHYTTLKSHGEFNRDLLTEASSYAFELILCDENKEKQKEDYKRHLIEIADIVFSTINRVYPSYKMINLLRQKEDISQNLYTELYSEDNFEEIYNDYNNFPREFGLLLKETWTIIGTSLGIYMYEEYCKDKNFINQIKTFNQNIGKLPWPESLVIINIKSTEELKEAIISSTESFLSKIKKES